MKYFSGRKDLRSTQSVSVCREDVSISPLLRFTSYPIAKILTVGFPGDCSVLLCRMKTAGSFIVYWILSPSSSDIFLFNTLSSEVSNSFVLILPPGRSQSPKLSFMIRSFPSFLIKALTATKYVSFSCEVMDSNFKRVFIFY